MTETEEKIRQVLDEFWEDRALPLPDGGTIVDELVPPVESMTAVDVLSKLEGIIGKEIPSGVIRAGGYLTKEQFIEHLTTATLNKLAGGKK